MLETFEWEHCAEIVECGGDWVGKVLMNLRKACSSITNVIKRKQKVLCMLLFRDESAQLSTVSAVSELCFSAFIQRRIAAWSPYYPRDFIVKDSEYPEIISLSTCFDTRKSRLLCIATPRPITIVF